MRLFWNNLIDAAGVGISASSAVSTLPASNLANAARTKVWRTGTSVAAEYVTFDLGSAQACTAAIILAHTLLAGDSLIQVRGSTDNFSASNVLVATFTWASGPMLIAFGSASYRYWRIAFTKASAGVARDIGRIFLGTYHETSVQPDYDGYEAANRDLSISQRSIAGQHYSDQRGAMREFRTDFSGILQTELDNLLAIFAAVGTHTSLFIQVDPSGPAELAEPIYCRFTNDLRRQVDGFDSGLRWNTSLEYTEQL